MSGSSPILKLFLTDPNSVFPPNQKHDDYAIDKKIQALTEEVKTSQGALSDSLKDHTIDSVVKAIDSLHLDARQAWLIHKLFTEAFMKAGAESEYGPEISLLITYAGFEPGKVDEFIKTNAPETVNHFLKALHLLDKKEQTLGVFTFLMALYQGRTGDTLMNLDGSEGQALLKEIVACSELFGHDGRYGLKPKKGSYEAVALFFQNMPLDKEAMKEITKAFLAIGDDNRTEVLQDAAPLFQGVTRDPIGRIAILDCVKRIPQQDRKQAIEDAAPVSKGMGPLGQAYVAGAIIGLTQPTREQVVESFVALALSQTEITDFTAFLIFTTKTIIVGMGPEKFIEAVQDAASIIQDVPDVFKRATLVQAVSKIPQADRAKVVEKIHSAQIPPKLRRDAIRAFPLIPPAYMKKAFESLREPDGSEESMFFSLLETETSKKVLHEHLTETLNRAVSSSREEGFKLSKQILDYQEMLGLHEEHPVFQMAIQARALTDPDSLKNPKNLYAIYSSLQKEEPLVDIPVPSSKIEDLSCSFDVQGLRSATEKLTFADLPTIDKQFFENTFAELEKREAISDFKNNLLGWNSIIPHLLKIEGEPDEPIPQSLFRLYTVIAYLTSLSNEREEGQELSKQEHELLTFANYVVQCKTGQEDGLASYYNLVVKRGFSSRQQVAGEPSLAEVKRFAESSIQTTLSEGFQNEDVLRNLIGLPSNVEVSQASHQTDYLKNKLFRLVGLQHTLTFDQGTGTLMDELIDKSAPELSEAFFKKVPFSKAVHDFQEKFNREWKAKGEPPVASDRIIEVLRGHLNDPKGDYWYDPYFTYDAYDTPIAITELGAAHLLIAAGFGKKTT